MNFVWIFLRLTTFSSRHIAGDVDDLCQEDDLFAVLKRELNLSDNFQFSSKQKNEVYVLLHCSDKQKHKRQLPYKRLLHFLSKP